MTNHWRDIKNADVILHRRRESRPKPIRSASNGSCARKSTRRRVLARAGARRSSTSIRDFRAPRPCRPLPSDPHGHRRCALRRLDELRAPKQQLSTPSTSAITPTRHFIVNEKLRISRRVSSTDMIPRTAATRSKTWAYETGRGWLCASRHVDAASTLCLSVAEGALCAIHAASRFETITGIPQDRFPEDRRCRRRDGPPDKVMTIVYAVGSPSIRRASQIISPARMLQLLLGNMGRPGGGMNAERGHANIQGNTDHAISWDILPGLHLQSRRPAQTIDDYVKKRGEEIDPNSWNYFGTNYKKFLVSRSRRGTAITRPTDNDFAFSYLPKPDGNSSWITI